MKAYLRIAEAAEYLSVCTKTIRRWDKKGKLACSRTPGGHRRIVVAEIERLLGGKTPGILGKAVAIYGRVSSHEQKKKGDLARQVDVVKQYWDRQGYRAPRVYQDVGSGLNTNRRGLQNLCQAVERGEINRVVVSYGDRLTRFGAGYLSRYFASHGARLDIVEQPASISLEEELVQDLIAIVTAFSGRLHGLRSKKARQKRKQQQRGQEVLLDRSPAAG